ncbi:MAG: PepSY domain-containing protein, partial [Sphingobacteriaceae bacterium]
YYVQEALHFGNFGGIGLKILYAFLGLTSGFLSISGFVVFLYRKNKKNANADQRTRRAVFLVCTLGLLLLATIAFISINLGYALAASFAEILINGLLIISALYLVTNFLIKNRRGSKSDNNLPPN